MKPADLEQLKRNNCLWQIPGGGYVAAGPTHDIRDIYPGATRLFNREHADKFSQESRTKK